MDNGHLYQNFKYSKIKCPVSRLCFNKQHYFSVAWYHNTTIMHPIKLYPSWRIYNFDIEQNIWERCEVQPPCSSSSSRFINRSVARSIYFSTIYSRIKYGIEIYGSAKKTLLNKLQVTQNKLLKLILRKDRLYSTNRLHSEMKILQINDIINTSLLNFVYDCLVDDPIPAFTNYFTLRNAIHSYPTRNNEDIVRPRPNSQIGKNTVHYRSSTLWNDLNYSIRNATSKSIFKRMTTAHYLEKYDWKKT